MADVVPLTAAVRAQHAVPGPADSPHHTVLLQTGVRGLQPEPALQPVLPLAPHPVSLPGDVVTTSPELTETPPTIESIAVRELSLCLGEAS